MLSKISRRFKIQLLLLTFYIPYGAQFCYKVPEVWILVQVIKEKVEDHVGIFPNSKTYHRKFLKLRPGFLELDSFYMVGRGESKQLVQQSNVPWNLKLVD